MTRQQLFARAKLLKYLKGVSTTEKIKIYKLYHRITLTLKGEDYLIFPFLAIVYFVIKINSLFGKKNAEVVKSKANQIKMPHTGKRISYHFAIHTFLLVIID